MDQRQIGFIKELTKLAQEPPANGGGNGGNGEPPTNGNGNGEMKPKHKPRFFFGGGYYPRHRQKCRRKDGSTYYANKCRVGDKVVKSD